MGTTFRGGFLLGVVLSAGLFAFSPAASGQG